MNELPIPPDAKADPKARELARVWAAVGKQHVTVAIGLWDDPAAWGMFLVDLAKHVASAYEKTDGRDVQETLRRIRAGFDVEWEAATDEPTGEMLA